MVFLAVSPDELPFFVHNSNFYRGGASVDAHIDGASLMEDILTGHDFLRMTLLEFFELGFVLEKRCQAR